MLYFAAGSATSRLSREDMDRGLQEAFTRIGSRKKVLALPPDITRAHSKAGQLTELIRQYYGERLTDILPAIGTHTPMTGPEITAMFGKTPHDLFRVHDWKNDLETLGTVPAEFVSRVSGGAVNFPWPAQVNRMLVHGGHDLILSIGQVVPHEVIGMANYNKNIFVGAGGRDGINKSHFLGAVYGMERIMGRKDTPVRAVLNYASEHFAKRLPIVYVLTVVGRDDDGSLALRGLFIGDDEECYARAAELSQQVNITMLDEPITKAVVYLDEAEYRSTWIGNKSIYRTRMAMADGGELIVLAPGVKEFGEDRTIDRLIRAYGYRGSEEVLRLTGRHEELRDNLGTAAHLIHGSSEGRFSVTYCPGRLTREEIEGVGFRYGKIEPMLMRYNPLELTDGYNTMSDGERVFFISNPAVGLWAWKKRFTGAA